MFHTSVGSLVHATLEDLNNCAIEGKESNITGMLANGTISAAQQRLLLIKLEELAAEHQGVLAQMDVILNLVPFVYRRNFTRYQRRMNRKELRRSFYGK